MRRFTFSPNAIGVGANVGIALIAPTPMALGLNVPLEAAGDLPAKAAARRDHIALRVSMLGFDPVTLRGPERACSARPSAEIESTSV